MFAIWVLLGEVGEGVKRLDRIIQRMHAQCDHIHMGVGKAHEWSAGRLPLALAPPSYAWARRASTMIRAVGLGRKPTGIIVMAFGFPAGVPRRLLATAGWLVPHVRIEQGTEKRWWRDGCPELCSLASGFSVPCS